jgi:hypothetical protein
MQMTRVFVIGGLERARDRPSSNAQLLPPASSIASNFGSGRKYAKAFRIRATAFSKSRDMCAFVQRRAIFRFAPQRQRRFPGIVISIEERQRFSVGAAPRLARRGSGLS